MNDCIDMLEKAFTELSNGSAVLPLRIGIRPPEGLALYMPAYLREMDALACKVVTVYKDNPTKHGLPTTIGKVLLQDPGTGEVVCIMDGGYLTACGCVWHTLGVRADGVVVPCILAEVEKEGY